MPFSVFHLLYEWREGTLHILLSDPFPLFDTLLLEKILPGHLVQEEVVESTQNKPHHVMALVFRIFTTQGPVNSRRIGEPGEGLVKSGAQPHIRRYYQIMAARASFSSFRVERLEGLRVVCGTTPPTVLLLKSGKSSTICAQISINANNPGGENVLDSYNIQPSSHYLFLALWQGQKSA